MAERRRRLPDWALPAVLLVGLVIGLLLASAPPPDRVDQLAHQLRCPVCQGESVADSNAETALSMEARIAELVEDGHSDEEVLAYFISRYGDWVLLDPPFDARNAALWLIPPLGLALGMGAVWRWRRTTALPDAPLNRGDAARLAAEIEDLRRREAGHERRTG